MISTRELCQFLKLCCPRVRRSKPFTIHTPCPLCTGDSLYSLMNGADDKIPKFFAILHCEQFFFSPVVSISWSSGPLSILTSERLGISESSYYIKSWYRPVDNVPPGVLSGRTTFLVFGYANQTIKYTFLKICTSLFVFFTFCTASRCLWKQGCTCELHIWITHSLSIRLTLRFVYTAVQLSSKFFIRNSILSTYCSSYFASVISTAVSCVFTPPSSFLSSLSDITSHN